MTLTNASKLPCKCEVMGQEARSQGLAIFTTSPNSGVIPAKGTLDVVVTLQASRLGRIQLPLQIKVCVMLLRTLTWDCDLSCAIWLCNWNTCDSCISMHGQSLASPVTSWALTGNIGQLTSSQQQSQGSLYLSDQIALRPVCMLQADKANVDCCHAGLGEQEGSSGVHHWCHSSWAHPAFWHRH